MIFLMNNIAPLIKHNKIVQISILCVSGLSLALSLFCSFLVGFLILGNYFLGLIACSLLLHYQSVAFPLIWDFTVQWKKTHNSGKNMDGGIEVCNVCSGSECRRYLKQAKTPWRSIRVKKKLNDAVEHIFNTILNAFIESWYGEFTSDVTFVSSLRNSIRYSTCLAVNKLMHLDTGEIISDKLIPCAIRHIDDYLCMERIARLKNIGIEQVAINYLGSRLHTAATNRKREVYYLRQVAHIILPHLAPVEYMSSDNFAVFMRELLCMWTLLPLMDVLADPNVINHLVILTTNVIRAEKGGGGATGRDGGGANGEQAMKVEILCNFGQKHTSLSPFMLELKSVLKDTELLYAFMQYLKKEDEVHLLQFYLDVEEFNVALLQPDLSSAQLHSLHSTATSLQQRYLDDDGSTTTHIRCDRHISAQLRHLLAGGSASVVRLRTSEPLLFAAADHVYQTLDRDWLVGFCRSAGFYNYLCKEKGGVVKRDRSGITNPLQLQCGVNSTQVQCAERCAVSRISTGLGKIKGALAVRAPVEGAPFCNAQAIQVIESQQQIAAVAVAGSDHMSLWKVSIPTVTVRERCRDKDQQAEKYKRGHSKWLFHIELESICTQMLDTVAIDSKIGKRDLDGRRRTLQWTVVRKECDFHTLLEKLSQIQSSSSSSLQFPSMTNSKISVEERRGRYEMFVRHLLRSHHLTTTPFYRHLLHNFLTAATTTLDHDNKTFPEAAAAASNTAVDLETIYQSVALRLRKEKGQHLDASFMSTFLCSTGQRPDGAHNGRQQLTNIAVTSKHHLDWADLSDAMDVASMSVSTASFVMMTAAMATAHGSTRPNTLHSHVFNDNFGLPAPSSSSGLYYWSGTDKSNSTNNIHPRGLTDSLFYLLRHIFKVRVFCLRVLAAVCSVAQGALESLARRYIGYKIRAALNEDNLTYLITQLEDVIFSPHHTSLTSEQLEERKREAFKQLAGAIPDRLASLLSANAAGVRSGAVQLLQILQNPHLNKHLAYNLLDLILVEIFPELGKSSAGETERPKY